MRKNFAMKKLYYSISEVSKITELEQYVLRYWETEFDNLNPAKNLAGNRIYTNKDIKLILYIKKLLRDEKYTIEGAKKLLKNYNEKEELSVKENKRERTAYKQPAVLKSNELSLFNFSDTERQSSQPDTDKFLKKDLIELKTFLTNLLDELENT
jgi:DNA-binding transcriptional MerR regulator